MTETERTIREQEDTFFKRALLHICEDHVRREVTLMRTIDALEKRLHVVELQAKCDRELDAVRSAQLAKAHRDLDAERDTIANMNGDLVDVTDEISQIHLMLDRAEVSQADALRLRVVRLIDQRDDARSERDTAKAMANEMPACPQCGYGDGLTGSGGEVSHG